MRALKISEQEIAAIRADWILGLSIGKICAKYRHGTEQIRDLADRYDFPDRGMREPLPAGHPLTWGVLIRGTNFERVPFRQIAALA